MQSVAIICNRATADLASSSYTVNLRKKGYTVEHNYMDVEEKRNSTFSRLRRNMLMKIKSFILTDRILITTVFFIKTYENMIFIIELCRQNASYHT